jgi:hypothetical protein
MANQDSRYHCYISTILYVLTGVPGARFLGCICKDGVGTITDVEGNIYLAKYIDILDNNLLLVVLKLENYQWIFM